MDNSTKTWIGVGVLVAIIAWGAQQSHSTWNDPAGPNPTYTYLPTSETPAPAYRNYCGDATSYERQAATDEDAGDYHGAFKNATHGLALNAQCSDDTIRIANDGYLLSMKGMAEHHLGAGDWQTDLNQANMELERCQTQPGLYGTHEGAQCETQQRNNITWQTSWEMGD